MRNDKPTCFKLLVQAIFCALALALARAGRSKPANMAMMAITTNSSMSVKAPTLCLLKTRFIMFQSFWVNGFDTLNQSNQSVNACSQRILAVLVQIGRAHV